jgi:hypothetical protein
MSTTTAPAETYGRDARWSADKAPSPQGIYAGEGRSIGGTRARNNGNPKYNTLFLEAARLYERVLSGNRYAGQQFVEAMTTSDFPLLFGDVLERQLLGFYQTRAVNWQLTTRRSRVRDFRTVKRFTTDGARGVLPRVAEMANYPAVSVTEDSYEYNVAKYGQRVPFSWEAMINDDLDALADMPQRLALGARRTEERFQTDLFVNSTGPDATFFSVGNDNIVSSNPALSITGLQDAIELLNNKTDADGAPIYIGEYVLEVPPALEVVANNLVNAVQIWAADGGGDGTGQNQLQVNNWLAGRLKIKVNPWLPIVDVSANKNTTWYVFASPGEARPAMEMGFLIGHETPEMFMKAPNALRIGGGGMVDPMAGDYDSDGLEYKIRHVLGGTLMDPKMAVASNGSGS